MLKSFRSSVVAFAAILVLALTTAIVNAALPNQAGAEDAAIAAGEGAAALTPENLLPDQQPVTASIHTEEPVTVKESGEKTAELDEGEAKELLGDAQAAGKVDIPAAPIEAMQAIAAADVTSEVAVAGLTWVADPQLGAVQVHYRLQTGDKWGAWTPIEVETEVGPSGRTGTEPISITRANKIEVAATAASGKEPSDAKLAVWDPGKGVADDAALKSAQPGKGASPVVNEGVTIYSRADWGADESKRTWPLEEGKFKGAAVHHTAGANGYTREQVPALIRGIYHYHAVSLGWGDIGYNVLVDNYGRAWQGRAGSLRNQVSGGHILGVNKQLFGISVMGNFSDVAPSAIAQDTVARVIAWKFRVDQISPYASATIYGGEKGTVTLPTVMAHRDVGRSACPGNAFYARMPNLRQKVQTYYGSMPKSSNPPAAKAATATAHDVNSDGTDDLLVGLSYGNKDALARNPNSGLGVKNELGAIQLDSGAKIHATNDFDSDGQPEVLVQNPNGDLKLISATNGGMKVKLIGWGWQNYHLIGTTTDWDRNGRVDVVAIHKPSGQLYLYNTDGRGKFTGRRLIGWGWQQVRDAVLVPTGDSSKLLASFANGDMYAYPARNNGGFGARYKVGWGWQNVSVSLAGDINRDGQVDLIGNFRDGSQRLYSMRGDGRITKTLPVRYADSYKAIVANGNKSVRETAWLQSKNDYLKLATLGEMATNRLPLLPIASAGVRDIVGVTDFNGDNQVDIVARSGGGELWLYAGSGVGRFAAPKTIGVGWSGFKSLAITTSTASRTPAVVGIIGDQVRVYHSDGFGRFRGGYAANTFKDAKAVVPLGSAAVGNAGLVGVINNSGHLFSFETNGAFRLTNIGHGWQIFSSVAGGLDLDKDGNSDIIGRQPSGLLLHYRVLANGRVQSIGALTNDSPNSPIK